MAEIDFKTVRELREETSAGIGLCKEALEKSGGDKEKAMEYIRKKGAAKSEKRAGRTAAEGVIGVYHHGVDERVAALVELNCETDFVARNEDFRKLAHELAMQVAAMKAQWVDRDSVPSDVVEKEKEIIMESDDIKDKPDDVKEKIAEGKLAKFYEENCLLEQKYFKDEDLTIQDLLDEAVAKIGEKIVVSRIYRMEVGG
jgi:elongation factor Ts